MQFIVANLKRMEGCRVQPGLKHIFIAVADHISEHINHILLNFPPTPRHLYIPREISRRFDFVEDCLDYLEVLVLKGFNTRYQAYRLCIHTITHLSVSISFEKCQILQVRFHCNSVFSLNLLHLFLNIVASNTAHQTGQVLHPSLIALDNWDD